MGSIYSLSYRFRRATAEDREECWQVIEQAKAYMASLRRCQWDGLYPTMGHVEADIANGWAYVMESDSKIIAYGAVIFTSEPAYASIDGEWLSDQPYVVLHRLCVADGFKGMGVAQKYFHEVEALALTAGIHSFKVDTNYDNAEMLHILPKLGFRYCGEVSYPQGSRKCFEKLL